MREGPRAAGTEEAAAHAELRVIEALHRGDEAAFARLVDEHPASLTRVARLYISNRAVVDEVVQDTWFGVIQGLWAFEGRSSLKTWIFRILIGPIGEPGAALVEADEPGEGAEALQEASRPGILPVVLEVGHEARHEDEVERPRPGDLIGDVQVAALRVLGSRHGVRRDMDVKGTVPVQRFPYSVKT